MAQIFPYEVELRVDHGGVSEIVSRIEYAYSPSDACTQVIIKLVSERPGCEIKVRKVGPPTEEILRASGLMAEQLADRLHERITAAQRLHGGPLSLPKRKP